MKKTAIILPAFNEESTIADAIKSFHEARPEAQIVVIDNASTDRTGDIAIGTMRELKIIDHCVIFEPKKGKGNALRRAFHEIDAEIYVIVDADLTYPAGRINDLIEPLLAKQADMVVGDRYSGGFYQRVNNRPFHDFGNRLISWLINFFFRASLIDIMSGYRALTSSFVKSYPILVEGFEIETDMTLHALDRRLRIIEIPVEYTDRPPGSKSKLNTFSDGAKVLFTIAKMVRYYKPLAFFVSACFLFSLLGVLAALPVFADWFRERYIHHVPLAILSTGFEIVAVLSLAVGLILDAIRHQDKQTFERELLRKQLS